MYPSIRKIFNFNTDWLFHKGEITGSMASPIDSEETWEHITLPHTVQLEPKQWTGSPSYQGVSYYYRQFSLDPMYEGNKIFIRFQGVMINADVWLNGKHLYTHHGGYLPFAIDLTDDVTFDESNRLIVKVDTNDDWETPPGKDQSDLDFVYFGGIYRHVDLMVTNPLHITDPHLANKKASGGVFVTYPEVSTESATISVQTHVKNAGDDKKNFRIQTMVVDKKEQEIVTSDLTHYKHLSKATDGTFMQTMTIISPKLWSMENPHLYTLIVNIVVDGEVVDDYQTSIGIRHIRFTSDDGFFINGENVLLEGVNFHEDYLYIGNAASDSMFYRDVQKIKAAGFNFIRTGHYPHNEAFMRACNELGMAVVVPTPGWQYYTDNGLFASRSIQMTREMIRLYRNYPSVVLWEPILNETWYPESFAKKAYEVVHEELPTDNVYAASDFGAPYGNQFDVVYKEAYSQSKPLLTREWGDANHHVWDGERSARKYGEQSLVRSAYHRQISLNGGKWWNEHDEDGYWDWAGLKANPRISGYALWSYNDYNRGLSSEISYSGIVDRDRYPKFNYRWFQSQQSPHGPSGPLIFIASYWMESSTKDIHVYTNTEEVSLYINHRYIGTEQPDKDTYPHITHPIVVFSDIEWERGELRAEGMIDGKVVAVDTVTTPEEPHHLDVAFDYSGIKHLTANGSDMIMAYVSIRDRHNQVVPIDEPSISLHVSGPGVLIGNGDVRVKANPVAAEAGIAPALIRSTLDHGQIVLTATAKGLNAGYATIQSLSYEGHLIPDQIYKKSARLSNRLFHQTITVLDNQPAKHEVENSGWCYEVFVSNKETVLTIDLGDSCNLTGAAIDLKSCTVPKWYTIQVNNPCEDWVNIVNQHPSNNNWYDYFSANARFIRIQFPCLSVGDKVNIQLFGTENNDEPIAQPKEKINIAIGKRAKASSWQQGHEANEAIDPKSMIPWQADSHHLPQWLMVDLEDVYPVEGAKILWGKDSTHYAYKIQVSRDGIKWEDTVEQVTTGSYYRPIDFKDIYHIRFLRIWIDNVLAGGGIEKVAIKSLAIYVNA